MSDQEQQDQTTPHGGASVFTGGLGAWLPMETAPKNCTLVLLLLAHDDSLDNAIEGEEEHLPRTIGHNNCEHDGEDRWRFAGWNWENDYYTEGVGTPIGWMPLPEAPNVEHQGLPKAVPLDGSVMQQRED